MKEYPWIIKINPIIKYPTCHKIGKSQDCFNCELHNKDICDSPRRLCIKAYDGHKKGCPNYGKKKGCPPYVRMFNEYFDLIKPIYAIYSIFDLKSHVAKMKLRHPDWTEKQCKNVLYWQGTARKFLKERIKAFEEIYSEQGYVVTKVPEAMGVNVTETLKAIGIQLEWTADNLVYKVAIAGVLKCDIEQFEEEAI